MRGTARTLSDDVYERLRDSILAGELAPGAKLRPSELRTEHHVSVGVVREALTRLAEQQLVVQEPNQGFSVPPLTRKNLLDITRARIEIEGITVRLAVEQGGLDWETELLAAHHRLERTPMTLDDGTVNPAWTAPHAAFHAKLLQGCDNATLLSICASLFRSSELYRRWAEPGRVHRDAQAEHRAITEAALRHDAEATVRLLQSHIELTQNLALKNIEALRADS